MSVKRALTVLLHVTFQPKHQSRKNTPSPDKSTMCLVACVPALLRSVKTSVAIKCTYTLYNTKVVKTNKVSFLMFFFFATVNFEVLVSVI